MKRLLIAGLALALLSGCALTSAPSPATSGTASSDPSPSAIVYAAAASLNQAEVLATAYVKSPVADPAVVQQLKALDNTAYAAIHPAIAAAEAGVSPITQIEAAAAQAALKALTDYLTAQGLQQAA
jgi:hypothetical protein